MLKYWGIFKSSILFLLLCSAVGSAENRVFTAENKYCVDAVESDSVAESRAVLRTKKSVVKEAIPTVGEYVKKKGTNLTAEQLYILTWLSTTIEVLSAEKVQADGCAGYVVKVKGTISSDKVESWTNIVSGNILVKDYNELLQELDEDDRHLEKLKVILKEKASDIERGKQLRKEIKDSEGSFRLQLLFEQGIVQFINNEYEDAAKTFTNVIEMDPRYVKALKYRGKVYSTRGQDDLAIKDYSSILKINPNDAFAYNNLGSIYFKRDQVDSAIEHFKKAITIDDNYEEAYNNRGVAYLKLKKYEQAVADFTKAISINPYSVSSYYNRGYAYYKLKDFKQAIDNCTKALSLNERLADAYLVRGLTYSALGEKGWASMDLKKACMLDAEDACKLLDPKELYEIEYAKAWAAYERREMDRALEIISKKLNPNDERLVLLLGLIYVAQEKPEEALDVIRKLKPMTEEAYRVLRRNEQRKPVTEKEKEILYKYYYTLAYISGAAYFQLDKCSLALNDLLVSAEKNPDVRTFDMIGTCYYKSKQYAESMKYYKRAYAMLEGGQEKDFVTYSLGSLNALLGDVDEAIRWLTIALSNPNRAKIVEKIKTDPDFDKVRMNTKFKKFLKEQERLRNQK